MYIWVHDYSNSDKSNYEISKFDSSIDDYLFIKI